MITKSIQVISPISKGNWRPDFGTGVQIRVIPILKKKDTMI